MIEPHSVHAGESAVLELPAATASALGPTLRESMCSDVA
jgi:hypothetical protein